MKKFLLVTSGVGIGYLLGARAGRPAYDRLVEAAKRAAAEVRLDRTGSATRNVVTDAKHAGEQLRDKADSRLAETVDKMGSVLPGTSTPTSSGDGAAPRSESATSRSAM
jgi:hypothetical protein